MACSGARTRSTSSKQFLYFAISFEGKSGCFDFSWRTRNTSGQSKAESGILLQRTSFILKQGCYDVGLPSKKSLFQYHCERIQRLQELASTQQKIPVLFMTSMHTHNETVHFFERHDHFGLEPDQVLFFQQSNLPCFAQNGEIILETPSKVRK